MTVSVGNKLAITIGSGSPTTIEDVESYTLDDNGNAQTYASSSTGGHMSRVVGSDDISGSFTILAEKVPDNIVRGTVISSATFTTATGVDIFAGIKILITDVSYTVDAKQITKAVIKWGRTS